MNKPSPPPTPSDSSDKRWTLLISLAGVILILVTVFQLFPGIRKLEIGFKEGGPQISFERGAVNYEDLLDRVLANDSTREMAIARLRLNGFFHLDDKSLLDSLVEVLPGGRLITLEEVRAHTAAVASHALLEEMLSRAADEAPPFQVVGTTASAAIPSPNDRPGQFVVRVRPSSDWKGSVIELTNPVTDRTLVLFASPSSLRSASVDLQLNRKQVRYLFGDVNSDRPYELRVVPAERGAELSDPSGDEPHKVSFDDFLSRRN